MGIDMDDRQRANLARNLRECRKQKFPCIGSARQCAEALGVSPQQWSLWERGMHAPNPRRLALIAKFFGKTVEYMQQNIPDAEAQPPRATELLTLMGREPQKAIYQVELCVMDERLVPVKR